MKILMFALMLGLASGCVSQQGRLAVLDLDFRKEKQLLAGAREAEAPYRDWTAQEQPAIEEVKTEALPLTWWELLMNMISKLECRVTLVRIEWADHRQERPKQEPLTPTVEAAP